MFCHRSMAASARRCSGRCAISASATARSAPSPMRCSKSRTRRVDQLAAHLRWHRLQPAEADQQAERRQLKLAWSWGMPAGAHQPTPLVHDGVMFLPTPGGGAQAVDATNGDFLWEFRAPQPREGNGNVRTTPTRNIAIYADKIYVTTGDARLIALNARTGDVVWDTQVMDPKQGTRTQQARSPSKASSSRRSPAASGSRTTSATSSVTTRRPARSCGARRRSRGPENPAAIPGTTSR